MTEARRVARYATPATNGRMHRAADRVLHARERERSGFLVEAIAQYELAITEAERDHEFAALADALRRLAVVRHQRGECEQARALCTRAHEVAQQSGEELLAGEALNTMGAMLLREGSLLQAQTTFLRALEIGGSNRSLLARVEQNLGIVANIQGDLDQALTRYASSLEEYRRAGDELGCASAYHNLGMVSSRRQRYEEADVYFRHSLEIAQRAGDVLLQGLCLLNHADVHACRQRFEEARKNAEDSLAIFDKLEARDHKASAYRVLGIVYRETGRTALAESRLRAAIELAVSSGAVLVEAEATRELAVVYQAMGRNQEALTLLNSAHRIFRRLDARIELVNVRGRMAELEGTYRGVVREWGQSIESSDNYTFGHCERVARKAVAVAKALGLDEQEQTAIRLGAYLHDVGKVKVPHEILNKPGRLSPDEYEVVQMHPVWGVELLASVEFPWDIKPIIRWHHEKFDGTGYPDRLRGDEIPLSAQVVGIADVYDAITSTRSYRPALTVPEAIVEMTRVRGAWSSKVFEAFIMVTDEARTHAAVRPAVS